MARSLKRRIARARVRRASRKAPPPDRDYVLSLAGIVRAFGTRLAREIAEQWPKWAAELGPKPADLRADVRAPREIRLVLDGVLLEARIEDGARSASQQQARRVETRNRANANSQVKQLLGVEPFGDDNPVKDLMDLFVEGNTGLITSVTQTQAEQIGQIVQRNLVSGVTMADTAKEIAERTDVAASRVKLIARDQTQKLNAQLGSARMQSAGVSKYEWSTSRDERVRETHASKEGRIFEFQDPPADTGNPGEDINCRCVAIPVLEEELES